MLLPIRAAGHGMFWEADEVARCVGSGKLESERMPLSESILVMEVSPHARPVLSSVSRHAPSRANVCRLTIEQMMDEVRNQCGLKYPAAIEKV